MKKKRINKKFIIIASVILLIILIEIINPIKLYNKNQLRKLNYSDAAIKTILANNVKDDFLNKDYNKALDVIFASKDYNAKNYSIYKELKYYSYTNFTNNINKLISKGYSKDDINNINRSGNDESMITFLDKKYIENISDYLKYDFSLLYNLDRYFAYSEKEILDKELVVVYVNIGLDKEHYEDYQTINKFSIDMLANKYNVMDESFVPDNLIAIDSTYAVDNKQMGNKEMVENFIKMSDACKDATGYNIFVRSGYRDYKDQQDTYDLYLKTYGKSYAESYVAHPGFSEHQTGLAVDLKAESNETFAGTKESIWMSENAYKYGFILRYDKDTTDITGYKYESWHYRYVGVSIATDMHGKDMTYDEYYIRFLNK